MPVRRTHFCKQLTFLQAHINTQYFHFFNFSSFFHRCVFHIHCSFRSHIIKLVTVSSWKHELWAVLRFQMQENWRRMLVQSIDLSLGTSISPISIKIINGKHHTDTYKLYSISRIIKLVTLLTKTRRQQFNGMRNVNTWRWHKTRNFELQKSKLITLRVDCDGERFSFSLFHCVCVFAHILFYF